MIRELLRPIVDSFPVPAMFFRNMRDLLDQRNPPRPTPWGFTLAGSETMAEGSFEPEETRLVRELLQDMEILVNVGANVGYYCCHALSLGIPVIAIEPNNRNVHYLLKNIRNNGWADQAQVYPVALGRDSGILEMWGSQTGASLIKGWASIPEGYVTQVPVLNFDRVIGNSLEGKRALILVDIEGSEFMMLEGALQTLDNEPRPIWIVEITSSENQPAGTTINPNYARTFDIFFSRGYRAFSVCKQEIEITEEVVARVQANQQTLEMHNFVFR